jgi:C4-dicarboxylate-specific signal transduction histidine kinase
LSQEGDKIRISIEDNGGGINDELKERIFDPYMTTKEHGTGIGLYMSRVIVEEGFGGKLYVKDGAFGAVFVVELERFSEN